MLGFIVGVLLLVSQGDATADIPEGDSNEIQVKRELPRELVSKSVTSAPYSPIMIMEIVWDGKRFRGILQYPWWMRIT